MRLQLTPGVHPRKAQSFALSRTEFDQLGHETGGNVIETEQAEARHAGLRPAGETLAPLLQQKPLRLRVIEPRQDGIRVGLVRTGIENRLGGRRLVEKFRMCPGQGAVGCHAVEHDIDQHAEAVGPRALGDVGQHTLCLFRALEPGIRPIGIVRYKNIAGSAGCPDGREADLIETELGDALEVIRPGCKWSGQESGQVIDVVCRRVRARSLSPLLAPPPLHT